MTGWADEWTYSPTKGSRRMQEQLQAKIEKVLEALRFRGEKDAAKAFAAMLEDNLTRLEITNAVTRFHLDLTGGTEKVRQGDVRELAKELEETLERVKEQEYRLARYRFRLDGIPDLPDPHEIARKGSDAFEGVAALACLANKLHRAVVALNENDKGGPALSETLAGDPLDHLAVALVAPWRRHGKGLEGRELKEFMAVLRAIHEAETDKEEIGRRIRDRLQKQIKNCT